MKRMHLHLGVEDLDQSIRFYSTLFGAEPVKVKPDYASWLLDDPRVNFAISTRAGEKGLDHLGLQVEQESELEEMRARFRDAEIPLADEGETVCCYARSDKSWLQDPAGIAWETYLTMEHTEYFSEEAASENACCAPAANKASQCCVGNSTGGCG